jgi:uncharacterized protein YbjT (DUF2867 family)
MKVAVAGATGRVGRHIVEVLESRGHHAVRISRSEGVDVISGEGLDAALAGVEAVIDAATGPSPDKDESIAFFTTAARNLHEAGERAGVQRLVTVSIIGIDEFVGGYSAGKLAHEQATLAGPIPARIVRAAQFHEFVGQLLAWGTQGDVAYVPSFRSQLVAAHSVAEVLVDVATAPEFVSDREATHRPFVEVAGPREESLVAMAELLAARRGDAITIQGVSNPDDPDAVLSEQGALLPSVQAILTGPTFEEWLDTSG